MTEDHFNSVKCVDCLPYYGYKDTGTFEFAGYDNSLLEGSTVETSAGPAFKNYKLSIKTTVAQGGDVRLIALEEVIAENSSNVANALSEASDALINSGTALDKANNVSEILDAVNTDDDLRSYGYSELTATADSYSYKKYISASDSAADKEGILKSITARFATAGTCKMCIARYDETHGYLDIDSTHTFTVAAGLQTIDLQAANIKVKADYQPFIMNSAGSVLMVGVKTDTKPNGYKPAIFSTDANEDVIQKGSSVYVEVKWSIFTKGLGLVDRFDEIKENDETVNNIVTNLESKLTQVERKHNDAKD